MRSILIQQMMEINKQRPQILDFLFVLFGVRGHDACEFEEVEEEGFGEAFEDEGAVDVFGWCWRGGVELLDSHFLKSRKRVF